MMTGERQPRGTKTGGRRRLEAALHRLGRGWEILADFRVDAPTEMIAELIEVDYLLLHPDRGVVLLDYAPQSSVAAPRSAFPEKFRRFLENRGFDAFFPGFLPVVHLALGEDAEATLDARIAAAFAEMPRLSITDPNWVESIVTVLLGSTPLGPAEKPQRPVKAEVAAPPPREPATAAPRQAEAPPKEPTLREPTSGEPTSREHASREPVAEPPPRPRTSPPPPPPPRPEAVATSQRAKPRDEPAPPAEPVVVRVAPRSAPPPRPTSTAPQRLRLEADRSRPVVSRMTQRRYGPIAAAVVPLCLIAVAMVWLTPGEIARDRDLPTSPPTAAVGVAPAAAPAKPSVALSEPAPPATPPAPPRRRAEAPPASTTSPPSTPPAVAPPKAMAERPANDVVATKVPSAPAPPPVSALSPSPAPPQLAERPAEAAPSAAPAPPSRSVAKREKNVPAPRVAKDARNDSFKLVGRMTPRQDLESRGPPIDAADLPPLDPSQPLTRP